VVGGAVAFAVNAVDDVGHTFDDALGRDVVLLVEFDLKKEDMLNVAALEKECKNLEKAMFAAARDLEFERAAELRDQLQELQERLMALK
jgi:excinuclease UvrABC helicase subunit UvrB